MQAPPANEEEYLQEHEDAKPVEFVEEVEPEPAPEPEPSEPEEPAVPADPEPVDPPISPEPPIVPDGSDNSTEQEQPANQTDPHPAEEPGEGTEQPRDVIQDREKGSSSWVSIVVILLGVAWIVCMGFMCGKLRHRIQQEDEDESFEDELKDKPSKEKLALTVDGRKFQSATLQKSKPGELHIDEALNSEMSHNLSSRRAGFNFSHDDIEMDQAAQSRNISRLKSKKQKPGTINESANDTNDKVHTDVSLIDQSGRASGIDRTKGLREGKKKASRTNSKLQADAMQEPDPEQHLASIADQKKNDAKVTIPKREESPKAEKLEAALPPVAEVEKKAFDVFSGLDCSEPQKSDQLSISRPPSESLEWEIENDPANQSLERTGDDLQGSLPMGQSEENLEFSEFRDSRGQQQPASTIPTPI